MGTIESDPSRTAAYPAQLHVESATAGRNRLTTAFRLLLAIPHLLLVGGPLAAALTYSWSSDHGTNGSAGGGLLGAVAGLVALISWCAIVFTGRMPQGLWDLIAFYLRWRVRAVAYAALLRDEYPPFGDGPYPAQLQVSPPDAPRDRLTVAFRLILAIPHLVAVWALSIAWVLTTVIAWFSILLTGRYPAALYEFGVGVFRWTIRVEVYLLLLRDEYPPFSLDEVAPSGSGDMGIEPAPMT
jgi:hypothetical protein